MVRTRPIFNQFIWDEDRSPATAAEQERLLGGDDEDPGDRSGPTPFPHTGSTFADRLPYSDLPVFTTIHQIRRDVIENLDDPYSLEQLRAPRMNTTVVRPMVDNLYDMLDISVVYCLMVNKVQFLREQRFHSQHHSLNNTRALLCELIASRILRRFDEDNPGPEGLLLLANILVYGFDPFQRCPDQVMDEFGNPALKKTHGYRGRVTALELAIVSESKMLLSSASSQKVIHAIYIGRVVYTPTTFIDMLPDHYKNKRILLYDPRDAPILNHYRLRVPRTRKVLEIAQFAILLGLYVGVMEQQETHRISGLEMAFIVYAFGWILEQLASMLEHGWAVYTQNLWAFLDVMFAVIYFCYFTLRLNGHHHGIPEEGVKWAGYAFNTLSVAAPVLIPRLAFNLLSENMLFISLREMLANFSILMGLAVWCFLGFFLALHWMSDEDPLTISKWMLWIWFGLDGTGIQESAHLNYYLGPLLMVLFAFLGNTLFLTILVSMLTNTFAQIINNANAEIQYRRAVMTFEGVKSDATSSFFPPFNIPALVLFLPLKAVLSARWFHKIIVATVRTLNLPMLLLIALYERQVLWTGQGRRRPSRPNKGLPWFWDFSKIAAQADTEIVFFAEPPPELLPEPPKTGELRPFANDAFKDAPAFQDAGANAGANVDAKTGNDAGADAGTATSRAPSAASGRAASGTTGDVAPGGAKVPSPHPHKLVRTSTGHLRKESVVGPYGELAEYLHDALEEHGLLGQNASKLETLESAVVKMAGQLQRICSALDDDVMGSSGGDGVQDPAGAGGSKSRGRDETSWRRGSGFAPSEQGFRRGSEIVPARPGSRRGSAGLPLRRDSRSGPGPVAITAEWRRGSSVPPGRRISEIFAQRMSDVPSRRGSSVPPGRRGSSDAFPPSSRRGSEAQGRGSRRGSEFGPSPIQELPSASGDRSG